MKRRRLLLGVGTAVGATSIVGSGAFSSVEASRDLTVSVADDIEALLTLRPADTPNGAYADVTDGTLSLDISTVNPNAVTVFDDVFKIENRGTQRIALSGDKSGSHPDAVVFGVNQATGGFTERDVFHTLDPDAPTGIKSDALYKGDQPAGNGSREIPVGHSYYVSLLTDTRGIAAEETLVSSLEIRADVV